MTAYLPCQWCGDPGEEAHAVVVNTETGDECGDRVEFITCRECLDRFTRDELGWPA
jgi:hypothetical protein